MWLNETLGVWLMAADRVAERTRHQTKALVVNAGGNLLLIPWLGISGAAIATLLSEGLLLALFFRELAPIVGPPRVPPQTGRAD